MSFRTFQFLDPGPLVDRELELIPPTPAHVDDVLAACAHPQTLRDEPEQARTTRQQLLDFLKVAPMGRQPGDTSRVPAYHFWMRLRDEFRPRVRIAGGIGLRIGQNTELALFSGHVGYQVYPPARGNHYAERACRLLLPLAHRHGLEQIWITCNPDNLASRRTCERLGARLVEIVSIPESHPFHARGETAKCRYLLDTA